MTPKEAINLMWKAKQIWPGLTVMELNLVLWSCTTYPLGADTEVLADLTNAYEKSGGDLMVALEQVDDAIMTGKHGR